MITLDTIVESRKKWVIDHIMPSDLDTDIKEGLKKKEELIRKINGDYIRNLYSNIDEIIDKLNKYNIDPDDYEKFINGQLSVEDINIKGLAKIHTFYSINDSEYIEKTGTDSIIIKNGDNVNLRIELEGNLLDTYKLDKVQWDNYPTTQAVTKIPQFSFMPDNEGHFNSNRTVWNSQGPTLGEGTHYIDEAFRIFTQSLVAGQYSLQIYRDGTWKTVGTGYKTLPDIEEKKVHARQIDKKLQFSFDGGETFNYITEWDFEYTGEESLEKCDYRFQKVDLAYSFSDYNETTKTRILEAGLLDGDYFIQIETNKGLVTPSIFSKNLTKISYGDLVVKEVENELPVYHQLEFSFNKGITFELVPEWFYVYETDEGSTGSLKDGNIRIVRLITIEGTEYKASGKTRKFDIEIPEGSYYLQMKVGDTWKTIGNGYKVLTRNLESGMLIVRETDSHIRFSRDGGLNFADIKEWDYYLQPTESLATCDFRLLVPGIVDGLYSLYLVFTSSDAQIEGLNDIVTIPFKMENTDSDLMYETGYVSSKYEEPLPVMDPLNPDQTFDEWKEQYRGLTQDEVLDKLTEQTLKLQDEIEEIKKEQSKCEPGSPEYQALQDKMGNCNSMCNRQCSLYNHCCEGKDIDDFELDDESDTNSCGTDFHMNNLPSLDPQMLILMFEVFLKRLFWPILKLLNYILGILEIDWNLEFPELPALELGIAEQIAKAIDGIAQALSSAIDDAADMVNSINLNAFNELMDRIIALICKSKSKILGVVETTQARLNHANTEYQGKVKNTKEEFKKSIERANNMIDVFSKLGDPTFMLESMKTSMLSTKDTIEQNFETAKKIYNEETDKLKKISEEITNDAMAEIENIFNSEEPDIEPTAVSFKAGPEIHAEACSKDPALLINIRLDLDHAFKKIINALDDALNEIADALTKAFDSVFASLDNLLNSLMNLFNPMSYDLGEGLKLKLPIIPDLGKLILDTLMKLLMTIINILCKAIQKVTDNLSSHLNDLIDKVNKNLKDLKNQLNHEIEELNKIFPSRPDMPEDCKTMLDQVKFVFETTVTDCSMTVSDKVEGVYNKFAEDGKNAMTKFCTLKPDSFIPNLDFLEKLEEIVNQSISGDGEGALDSLSEITTNVNEMLDKTCSGLVDRVADYRKQIRPNTPEEDEREAKEKADRQKRQEERDKEREEISKRRKEREQQKD